MADMRAVDFHAWVESVRPTLAPPVGNKLLYGDGQHKVMIVGGPNSREDYHIEAGEEIFFQLIGDMDLPIILQGKPVNIPIREGEIFLLPGRIPHSPQRKAGTVGLVMERERLPDEIDGLRWYARDGSERVLYEEFFHCTDLGVQLKPVIDRFFAMECYRTGVPDREFPPPPIDADAGRSVVMPFSLDGWVAECRRATPDAHAFVMCGPGAANPDLREFEYSVHVHVGSDGARTLVTEPLPGEVFVYQRRGESHLTLTDATSGQEAHVVLAPGHVVLVPGRRRFAVHAVWGDGLALVITNRVIVTS